MAVSRNGSAPKAVESCITMPVGCGPRLWWGAVCCRCRLSDAGWSNVNVCLRGTKAKGRGWHLRAIGAHSPKTTFHSYRHCATDALREAGVPPDRIRAIMGWAGGGMEEAVYGGGLRPRTLAREIRKVRYEGLDLGYLHAG